jgi:hypothetical protein
MNCLAESANGGWLTTTVSLSFEVQRPLGFASAWNEETLRRRASCPWYMDRCKSLDTKPRSPLASVRGGVRLFV